MLFELAHQLRVQEVELDIAWRPREENIEADALTNHDYTAFDPAKRVAVAWEDLKFGSPSGQGEALPPAPLGLEAEEGGA